MFERNFRQRAFILFVVFVITGCGDNREAGLQLANKGEETSKSLEGFYTKLHQYKADEAELEAFDLGTRDTAIQLANLQKRIQQLQALDSRIRLARTMKAAYASLKDLSEYNARAEIKESAGKLMEGFGELVPFPGEAAPSTIFGTLMGELAAVQQSGDIRDGAKALRSALAVTIKLYDVEHPDVSASEVKRDPGEELGRKSFDIKSDSVYDVIVEERYKNLWDAVDKLAKSGALENATFMPDAIQPLMVQLRAPSEAEERKRIIKGFRSVSAVRLFRAYQEDLDEIDLQRTKLANLLKSHDELFERHNREGGLR